MNFAPAYGYVNPVSLGGTMTKKFDQDSSKADPLKSGSLKSGNIVPISEAFGCQSQGKTDGGQKPPADKTAKNMQWTPDELYKLAFMKQEGQALGLFSASEYDRESFAFKFTGIPDGYDQPQELVRLEKLCLDNRILYMAKIPKIEGVNNIDWTTFGYDFTKFINDVKSDINQQYNQSFNAYREPVFPRRGH